MMLKWVLFVVLGVPPFGAIPALVGMALPTGHRASRTVVFSTSPDRVFATISDFARFPEWRSDVKGVEILGDDGRGVRFREKGRNGTVHYRVGWRQQPRNLV